LAEELKDNLDVDAELVPVFDGMGRLDIYADNQLIFSSLELGRFPEDGEIVTLLKEYSPPV